MLQGVHFARVAITAAWFKNKTNPSIMSVCCEPEQTTPSTAFSISSDGCASHRAKLPHTTAPRLPFSAHHARVASAATANVSSVFPLSLTLQPHVLPHLLVRCLQACYGQAPASSSGRFVRQLRRDGETARSSCSCLRCGLPRLRVTRCCADCGVLCVRCGGRKDAVSVVEDG